MSSNPKWNMINDKFLKLKFAIQMVFIFKVSWPNLVPAVAVRQGRLAFFIFIRFKGYLDGISSPKRERIY